MSLSFMLAVSVQMVILEVVECMSLLLRPKQRPVNFSRFLRCLRASGAETTVTGQAFCASDPAPLPLPARAALPFAKLT